jgi:hypothetical protein
LINLNVINLMEADMKSTLVIVASAGLLLSVTAATAAESLGAGSAGGMATQGVAPSTPQTTTGYAPGQMREESPTVPGSPSVPSIAPGAAGNSANGGAPVGGTMSPSAGGAQSSGY